MIDASKLSQAEKLLWSFGITSPEEIHLDAIAFELGIIVKRRQLDGADARLVAANDRGVITVSVGTHPKRQRFSIGHEIGHWIRDRDGEEMLACSKADVSPRNQSAKNKEAEANVFSADLLLPPYLVRPLIGAREPTIDLTLDIGKTFDTSIPATAIRIVRNAKVPAAVVVHSQAGRDWYFKNAFWPMDFQLASQVHHDSPAMDLLYSGIPLAKSRDQKEPASRWVWGPDANRIEVRAQTIKRRDDRVLTILRLPS